jgi:HSP20 family protein
MVNEFARTWEPLLSLQHALERAMNEDFFGFSTTNRGVFPGVSVFKGQEELLLTAEMPGVNKDDIHLEIKNDLFRVYGERRPDFDSKEVSTHRREREYGSFDRTLKLPFRIEAEKVVARYENGILKVNLPLAESAKTRKVQIA